MIKLYSVFDVKSATYGAVIGEVSDGLAVRAFSEVCQDARSPMAKYPSDFSLRAVGEFDASAGKLTPYPEPVFIAEAAQFVKQVEVQPETLQEVLMANSKLQEQVQYLRNSVLELAQRVAPSAPPSVPASKPWYMSIFGGGK